MSEDKDILKDHEYDGIQEYDNPLPAWWLTTFFITIIFGFLYWIHYEFGGGTTQWAELKADMAKIEAMQKNAPVPADSEEDLIRLAASGSATETGKALYEAKCAACHGDRMQGLIGPNLVDDFWIHGQGKISGIVAVVRDGILDKGMPGWAEQMKPEEINAVSAFIFSQQGTEPPNPKEPQGDKVVRN